MSGSKMRENILLVALLLLLSGVAYYAFFYMPLQTELQGVETQVSALEKQNEAETAKAEKLRQMKKELNSLISSKQETEVANYDNSKAIMSQLNGILASADSYSLSFGTPAFGSNGVVRRQVAVSFTAPSYTVAKAVIQEFAQSRWRCLVNSISFASAGGTPGVGANIMSGAVSVNATITYFERALTPSAVSGTSTK